MSKKKWKCKFCGETDRCFAVHKGDKDMTPTDYCSKCYCTQTRLEE